MLTLGAAFALLLYRFFRDPERHVSSNSRDIVSPADGQVIYIRESQNGRLPLSTKHGRTFTLSELTKTPLQMKDATVIGIGMSFLDVHVNRAPVAGRVLRKQHFPGLFGSLRKAAMVFSNERMTTIIEHENMQIAVVQIASRLVRQIVSFVDVGQQVQCGQRIGVIRFGSQVDLVLPRRADLHVLVKPGDRVTAGESIVAVRETTSR
jgi:phosphatidylserine decarboxylase